MDYFNLPERTKVKRVIPKNAFDTYTNTKQKKLLTDQVLRITWLNKLSTETTNLIGKDIEEIQLFKVELKEKVFIDAIIEIIEKSIPYHLVLIVVYDEEMYISASSKHLHPTNPNTAVIDWTFKTEWFNISDLKYSLNLKKSLDDVFEDICYQLSGRIKRDGLSFEALINQQREKDRLQKEISRLKSSLSREKQFNKKVELNMRLKELEKAIKRNR